MGMATVYGMLGIEAKRREWAERGLSELQRIKQSAAGQAMRHSTIFPLTCSNRKNGYCVAFLNDRRRSGTCARVETEEKSIAARSLRALPPLLYLFT